MMSLSLSISSSYSGVECRVLDERESPCEYRIKLYAVTSSSDANDKARATINVICRNFVPVRHADVL